MTLEKILSQEELALGFVHKLNNHLVSVLGYGELLLPKMIDAEGKKDLTGIIAEAKQASQVSKDLANLLREGRLEPRQRDARQVL